MVDPRILIGAYGDGTFGLKTSTIGNDVTDTAHDNDSDKRSLNSQWSGLLKIKMIGVTQGDWVVLAGTSFWQPAGTPVATGLTYMPIWEERIYNPTTKTFYDDKPKITSGGGVTSTRSGGRSWFGNGSDNRLPPYNLSNTIYFAPNIHEVGAASSSPKPALGDYAAYIVYAKQIGTP